MGMTSIVEGLGILGVFLLMVPESACIPIPSEATLLSAGVGVQHGWFSLPVAIAAATAGNLAGSLLAYWLGRKGTLARLPSGGRAVVSRCERLFDRWGHRAVFIARLLPLARTFISLPAGHAGVPLRRFVPMTVAGCALWSGALIVAGSAGWEAAAHAAGAVLTAATLAAVVALAVAQTLMRRN